MWCCIAGGLREGLAPRGRVVSQRQTWQGPMLLSAQRFAAVPDHVHATKPNANRRAAGRERCYVGLSSSLMSNTSSRAANFVEIHAAHGKGESMPGVRPIEKAPTNVLKFGCLGPETIRDICQDRVPGWSVVPRGSINIDQVCEGLSNQNFKVYLDSNWALGGIVPCVLFRIYGKDVHTLYDAARELQIVKFLSEYQVAPRVYAHGDGWRIEEWHKSVPLPNRRMRNPAIFTQVAAHLGRLHKMASCSDFPHEIVGMPVLSSLRLNTWADGCQRAAAAMDHPKSLEMIAALGLNEVLAERDWLSEFVKADDPRIHGSGLDVVFSHWDNQENNILQTHYGLRFIDFEYSGMDYQAFDIATYFVECTIDYIVDEHPFYKVSLADFPTEEEQKLFCSIYLSEYLETIVKPNDLAVSVLLKRAHRFALLVHYVWTLWSVIRAPQAPTFNDFDYLQFAQTRFFMYKWAKREVLEGRSFG